MVTTTDISELDFFLEGRLFCLAQHLVKVNSTPPQPDNILRPFSS